MEQPLAVTAENSRAKVQNVGGDSSEKTLARQSRASEMLSALGGDETWTWALKQAKENKDYKTAVDIMKYWTDRAGGKAPQAINLKTDTPIVISYPRDPLTAAVVTPDKPAQ